MGTTNISEVTHFTHKSCYSSRNANQAQSPHFLMYGCIVHYEVFTKTFAPSPQRGECMGTPDCQASAPFPKQAYLVGIPNPFGKPSTSLEPSPPPLTPFSKLLITQRNLIHQPRSKSYSSCGCTAFLGGSPQLILNNHYQIIIMFSKKDIIHVSSIVFSQTTCNHSLATKQATQKIY